MVQSDDGVYYARKTLPLHKILNTKKENEVKKKLTNFGMCKLIKHDRTYTICGTAEYMAPEVIANKGYGLAADWWSFGVLIYELCNGLTPFYAKEIVQTFHLIMHNDYNMPVHFSPNLQDLIKRLLQPDNTKRLGNLQKGVDDLINHYWFKSIDNHIWLAIINRRIISPIIPFISDETFFEKKSEPYIIGQINPYGNEFENF
ncbi:hypothetical protein O3M35_012045 [Rhynocoris fuscipes]|uniref:Protein kinase domain-containing protein n=1 Tax=Rhynocoris fuscipes TaxID=488301 RepID=A0AAW1CSN7_9HEMI